MIYINNRLRANISAFYYEYQNLQFQSTDPDVYRGGVANIPESEMSGLEVELIGLISESLSLICSTGNSSPITPVEAKIKSFILTVSLVPF